MQTIAGKRWTRRQVLRSGVSIAALSQTRLIAPAFGSSRTVVNAYVGVSGGPQDRIHVFSTSQETWTETQQIHTKAPACLVVSACLKNLYVANDVTEVENLRRGSVESFRIDSRYGRLEFQSVQPLSLAATHPRSIAISPDGRLLAVASHTGGIYNLLPIAEDGALKRPVHIFKSTGSGVHAQLQGSAHPHTLLFHKNSGYLLSSDFGGDHLNTFGMRGDRLERNAQHAMAPATGPGSFVLHPNGRDLFVWNELAGSLTVHRFDGATGSIGPHAQWITMGTPELDKKLTGSICVHPSGKTLYSACQTEDALTVWNIEIETGRLIGRSLLALPDIRPIQIVAAPEGTSVFVVDSRRGSIVQVRTHASTGIPFSCRQVAAIGGAKYLVLRAV